MIGNPRIRVFVGKVGGVLVTSCTLVVVPNLTRACRPWACIESVVTRFEYRRRGYGCAVLARALAAAWAAECYKVTVMTGTDAAQQQFYEAAGFTGNVKRGFVAYPRA